MRKKTVKILPEHYKPTQKELAEDFRIDATPEAVAAAVVSPVKVVEKYVSDHRSEVRDDR